MALLMGLLWPLDRVNTAILAVCRVLAMSALAIMVGLILYQIVMRYVFNAAPNWTEEGARFLMLWMVGLIGPLAYRQGGFVAIDLLERGLPHLLSRLLVLVLLSLAMLVILRCVQLGWTHVNSFTARGTSASLRVPLDWVGGERLKFRNAWMFSSLFVGFCLLTLVNIELILRQLIRLAGQGDRLRPLEDVRPID
ncbi:MAG: TRAP transporter small permease [Shimia sp.]